VNLVPEHINEAIKHLTPRSQKEISIIINKRLKQLRKSFLSKNDKELFDDWAGWNVDFTEEAAIYKELKNRNSRFINMIKNTKWYSMYYNHLNEST